MSLNAGAPGEGAATTSADYSLPLKIPLPFFYFTVETDGQGKGGGDVQEEVPEHTSQRHGGMRSGVDKILSPFLVGRNNS